MTPERALRESMQKAGEAKHGLALEVSEVEETVQHLEDLGNVMGDEPLIALLKARDGALGLFSLDAQLLAALAEIQITGSVSDREAEQRPSTNTDLALSKSFVDAVFEHLEVVLSAEGRGPWFYGYRADKRIEAARKIGVRLEDGTYMMYRLSVALNEHGRVGQLMLALPSSVRQAGANGALAPDLAEWERAMGETVKDSSAVLRALLHRVQLPIQDVSALSVGHILPIPRQALDAVQLVDLEGGVVSKGKLGQAQGFRAVRLSENVLGNNPEVGFLPAGSLPPT